MSTSFDNLSKTKYRPSALLHRLLTASMSLPNILSLARIVCIPVIAFCIIHFHEYNNYRYIAVLTMFCAGLSDWLDGYLARKRNETSKLGIYLDSVADKLLVTSIFILLSCDNLWPEPRIPNWLAMIIIGKDIVIIAGVLGVLYFTRKIHEPSILSKVSTDLQIGTITLVLLGNFVPLNIILTSFSLVAILACVSTVDYICLVLNVRFITKR